MGSKFVAIDPALGDDQTSVAVFDIETDRFWKLPVGEDYDKLEVRTVAVLNAMGIDGQAFRSRLYDLPRLSTVVMDFKKDYRWHKMMLKANRKFRPVKSASARKRKKQLKGQLPIALNLWGTRTGRISSSQPPGEWLCRTHASQRGI